MGQISKFISLEHFLKKQDKQYLLLSFEEMERIIGEKLCPSAYKYTAYWHPSKTHVLPNLIIECGYKIVEINLPSQLIKLQKK